MNHRAQTSTSIATTLALSLLVCLALTACGKKEADKPADKAMAPTPPAATAPAPTPDKPADREVRITAFKPEGATLKVGDTVKVFVGATYRLPANGGSIGIVVQDGKNTAIANKLVQVATESGTVTEEIEFKVPQTDRIFVHVPLYAKGDNKSSTVASRELKVASK